MEKARKRKKENQVNRYHAQRAGYHAQRAAAKGLVAKLTCDVCKSCSFDTFEKSVARENQRRVGRQNCPGCAVVA